MLVYMHHHPDLAEFPRHGDSPPGPGAVPLRQGGPPIAPPPIRHPGSDPAA